MLPRATEEPEAEADPETGLCDPDAPVPERTF